MARSPGAAIPALTVSIAILAGCAGNPAGTRSSSTTPTPAVAASPSPRASASDEPPSATAPGATDPSRDPTVEWHAIDCSDGSRCRVEYVADANPTADGPGWPVLVPGRCLGIARAADSTVYAACDGPEGGVVHHLSSTGDPMVVPAARVGDAIASVYENLFTIACGDSMPSLRIAADGRILVAVVERGKAWLLNLRTLDEAADGPRFPFPGDPPGDDGIGGNGCRGFTPGNGAVLTWGYQDVEPDIELVASRTEFIVYDASGNARNGWPRGSQGAASRPVLHHDGSVSYTSATGRVWLHAPDGDLSTGLWPYQLNERHAPYATRDGRIVVMDSTADGPVLVTLERDGRVARGWPARLPDAVETRCLFGDVPCSGSVAPLVSPDGRVYVALATGSVVGFDSTGIIAAGWPVHLGANAHALSLTVGAEGVLVVRGVVCPHDECAESGVATSWTIDRAGEVTQ